MKRDPRILGYVMARNEWPLLGAAIIHALSIGVDSVVVLDHGSNDGSSIHLKGIQDAFPNRVRVLRLNDQEFFQEATTSVVGQLHGAHEFDWIYVFDADEFLLVDKQTQLKEILKGIPSHISAIRYPNQQWVAPHDLVESKMDDYFKICQRSIPNLFIDLPGDLIADEIEHGNLNYFDIPFPTKVMVRGHLSNTLSAGAHISRNSNSVNEVEIDSRLLRLAHLPFRSYRALERKAEQGKALIDAGFPFGHGWQSQLIYKLQKKSDLEEFWRAHSSSKNYASKEIGMYSSFSSEEDWEFAEVLRKAFHKLEEIQSAIDLDVTLQGQINVIEESTLPMSVSVKLVHDLIVERNELTQQRDELTQQRDELTQQRDELTQQRDELLNSTIWKATKPIRWFVDLIKP